MIDYLKSFPREADAFLFTTLKKNLPLVPSDVRKHVKKMARQAGVIRRVYPHLFRHSLATNLLNRGANLTMIKEQLGHVYYESTLIYAISTPFRVKSEYEFCKPAYI